MSLEIHWNVEAAFIGTVGCKLPPAPAPFSENEVLPDNRTLLFSTFLATCLLPSGPLYREEKCCGNEEIGHNSGVVGEAIDAYAHHVVADSHGTLMLADIQGESMV